MPDPHNFIQTLLSFGGGPPPGDTPIGPPRAVPKKSEAPVFQDPRPVGDEPAFGQRSAVSDWDQFKSAAILALPGGRGPSVGRNITTNIGRSLGVKAASSGGSSKTAASSDSVESLGSTSLKKFAGGAAQVAGTISVQAVLGAVGIFTGLKQLANQASRFNEIVEEIANVDDDLAVTLARLANSSENAALIQQQALDELRKSLTNPSREEVAHRLAPFAYSIVDVNINAPDPINLRGEKANARRTSNNRRSRAATTIQRASSEIPDSVRQKFGGQVPDSFESIVP